MDLQKAKVRREPKKYERSWLSIQKEGEELKVRTFDIHTWFASLVNWFSVFKCRFYFTLKNATRNRSNKWFCVPLIQIISILDKQIALQTTKGKSNKSGYKFIRGQHKGKMIAYVCYKLTLFPSSDKEITPRQKKSWSVLRLNKQANSIPRR